MTEFLDAYLQLAPAWQLAGAVVAGAVAVLFAVVVTVESRAWYDASTDAWWQIKHGGAIVPDGKPDRRIRQTTPIMWLDERDEDADQDRRRLRSLTTIRRNTTPDVIRFPQRRVH